VKAWKRVTIVLLPLLLVAIAYLLYTNGYLNRFITVEGEAKLVNISLPSETQNVKYFIDEVKMVKLKWIDALYLRGWVFTENTQKEKRNVFMVLKGKDDTRIFEIKKDDLDRPDVTSVFHMKGRFNNHGFELNLPMQKLKDNFYQIGYVIEDETGWYYSLSNQAVKISNNTGSVVDLQPNTESGFISKPVSLTIAKPTNEISFFIDQVDKTDSLLIIQGWGFLQGLNAKSLKSYVLLKKNDNVAIFDIWVRERKDVTKVFIQSGLNLDSSGIVAKIPSANLEAGKYQLGFYIVKGNQSGIVYSDKFIDVGK
jgi:hypothetical protein